MMPPAGTRLGPYEIVAPLGAGGMGGIAPAIRASHREVAIKVIAENLAQDADAIRRFEQETRAVAALSHPNILSLHDIGQIEVTLTDRPRPSRSRSPSSSTANRCARGSPARRWPGVRPPRSRGRSPTGWRSRTGAASSIATSPENVFLTSDGRVKILDFGLAHAMRPLSASASSMPTVAATTPGAILGTIGYAAPEQIRGDAAGPAADIFSLGCILYEMAAGRRAFEAPTAADTLAALLHTEPPALLSSGSDRHVPLEYERIVQHCLGKKVAERFQSARDLGIALDALLSDTSFATPGGAATLSSTPSPGAVAAAHAAGLAHAAQLVSDSRTSGSPDRRHRHRAIIGGGVRRRRRGAAAGTGLDTRAGRHAHAARSRIITRARPIARGASVHHG